MVQWLWRAVSCGALLVGLVLLALQVHHLLAAVVALGLCGVIVATQFGRDSEYQAVPAGADVQSNVC